MSLAALMNRLHATGQLKHLTLIAPANGGFEANVIHQTKGKQGVPKTRYSTALSPDAPKALLSALRAHEKLVAPVVQANEDLI